MFRSISLFNRVRLHKNIKTGVNIVKNSVYQKMQTSIFNYTAKSVTFKKTTSNDL